MTMKVLVADDHSLFRDGIVSLLEAAGFTVIEQVGDGYEAVEAAIKLNPDLVLMDISMPELNGLEALKQIKAKAPEIDVVMLTVSENNEDLLEAVQLGASGYLLKNLNAEEFIHLLEGLAKGEAPLTRKMAMQLLHGLSEKKNQTERSVEPLTDRETELLRLVAQGLPNRAVGERMSISENTVKYHMKNILQKLAVNNRTEAVTRAIQSGIIDPEPRR
jgi:DNA-binding NarL/FixJ family response regulator